MHTIWDKPKDKREKRYYEKQKSEVHSEETERVVVLVWSFTNLHDWKHPKENKTKAPNVIPLERETCQCCVCCIFLNTNEGMTKMGPRKTARVNPDLKDGKKKKH